MKLLSTLNIVIMLFAMVFHSFSQEKSSVSNYPISDAIYPGGYAEMTKFIQENLEIPASFNGSGTVNLRFIISETGQVTNVMIRRGIEGCDTCSDAAVAVMNKMPNWAPAYSQIEKKNVESIFVLPIKFEQKLQKK
jgi:TonB family protein